MTGALQARATQMLHVEQELWSLSVALWAALIAFLLVRRITGGVPW